MWEAVFILTLARETGFSRDYIFWELHLAELQMYRHGILRAEGHWTISLKAAAAPVDDQWQALLDASAGLFPA